MLEESKFKSILELRKRIYNKVNQYIGILNSLNDIIFENSLNKPEFINEKDIEEKNISLLYIQNGIEMCHNLKNEINEKVEYILMIKTKCDECVERVKLLRRDKKYHL